MKTLKFYFIFLFVFTCVFQAQNNTFLVKVKNPIRVDRKDVTVRIPTKDITALHSNFKLDDFCVFDGLSEVPFQIEKNKTLGDQILVLIDLKSADTKELKFVIGKNPSQDFPKRTYAEIAMKKNLQHDGKKFRGTVFTNVEKVKVPVIHTDHDALFKYEGPGWESDKVGYRFYLDWRNATDIFGKKVNELVLSKVGITDTVASNDSYHTMQDWGMDIFKVGTSLGIGSLGMLADGKVNKISKTDSINSRVSKNGCIESEIATNYYGWLVGEKKYNVESRFSITAGSRLTRHTISVMGEPENLVTGLAKNSEANLLKCVPHNGWGYLALYGKQSLAGDNLGIAIFFKKKDMIEITQDSVNEIVKLKPNKENLEYYFCAAWEQEPGGIKTQDEFEKYLINVVDELNNTVTIEY
ncbi:MAG: hypothetical protein FD143_845 [Ignavibacteria bacterium]|nr:MAG: hypothetical protein FD143_845 [Ignavibacteria bacterium]KAF0161089.1 MAG: hypothetical protein FD188_1000 [Ignavibacteria bacterium]